MPRRVRKAAAASGRPVEAVRHRKDERVNIPTAELEPFADETTRRPETIRYPRDPSLDPQLVWKGKDEQDASDVEVPAVPIYIQEQIEPRAIIEDSARGDQGRDGSRSSTSSVTSMACPSRSVSTSIAIRCAGPTG